MKRAQPADEKKIRAIKALLLRKAAPGTIASQLDVPVSLVKHVKESSNLDDVFKSKAEEHTPASLVKERIEEFERIMNGKKSSIDKGKELWDRMAERHKDYKESWEADSRIEYKFPKNRFIGIVYLSDFHLGHEGVDMPRLEKDVKILNKTDNMYSIWVGDEVDNFLDMNKHAEAVLNSVAPPKDQLYMMKYLISLIDNPKSKILLTLKSNHVAARLKKHCGVDYYNSFWSDRGVFYGGDEVYARLQVGNIEYNTLTRHSYRGGSKVHLTAACKALMMKSKYENIDVVALGHTHCGALELFQYRGKMRLAVQASTYKTFDTFGASLGFDPSVVFMPMVILNPCTKEFIPVPSIETGAMLLDRLNSKK